MPGETFGKTKNNICAFPTMRNLLAKNKSMDTRVFAEFPGEREIISKW